MSEIRVRPVKGGQHAASELAKTTAMAALRLHGAKATANGLEKWQTKPVPKAHHAMN
jgi:hypothetical protein